MLLGMFPDEAGKGKAARCAVSATFRLIQFACCSSARQHYLMPVLSLRVLGTVVSLWSGFYQLPVTVNRQMLSLLRASVFCKNSNLEAEVCARREAAAAVWFFCLLSLDLQ